MLKVSSLSLSLSVCVLLTEGVALEEGKRDMSGADSSVIKLKQEENDSATRRDRVRLF